MRDEVPSRTARKVALNVVSLGSRPGMEEVLPAGIVEATAKLLVASGAVGRGAVRFSRSRLAVGLYRLFDWIMPGQFEAFAHRKAFCERQVREGIAAGAEQVLVLGAGYDTLGWRLAPELPGVRFFEIDHPATAQLKARGIEVMAARDNLRLIAVDLGRRELGDVLGAERAWEPASASVIVAEGLLMYLPPAAVEALFQQCARVSGNGSRMVFTHAGTSADGRPDAGPHTGLTLWLLEAGGEPWLWSIRPGELGPFLEDNGWALASEPQAADRRIGVEYVGVAVK